MLEDLHWADLTTLQLLRQLFGDLSRLAVLVVVTGRDPIPGTPWSMMMPDLLRSPVTTLLALNGLSVSAVATWCRRTPATAGWAVHAALLCERANGNPFYIGLLMAEPPAADRTDVLDGLLAERVVLRAAVISQLGGLSPQTRHIVDATALLGEHASPELLAGALDLPIADVTGAIAEAQTLGVLRRTEFGLSFSHALIRDAVVADLPPDRRARLHRAIALALAGDESPGMAGSIAEHWYRASGPDAAEHFLTWSGRGAVDAGAMFAHDRAVDLRQRSLGRALSIGKSQSYIAELTVELAEAQFADSGLSDAIGTCLQAADIATRAARPDLVARAALVIRGLGAIDIARVVKALCERALQDLPIADTALHARLLAQLAIAEANNRGGHEAAPIALKALAAAQRSGDPLAEMEALAARHLTITAPETVDEGEELARRAIELGRTAIDPMAALWGHLWLLAVHFQRGDVLGIDEELEAIDRIATRRHFPLARWHHLRAVAARAALLGEFAEAQRANDASMQLAMRMVDVSMIGVVQPSPSCWRWFAATAPSSIPR